MEPIFLCIGHAHTYIIEQYTHTIKKDHTHLVDVYISLLSVLMVTIIITLVIFSYSLTIIIPLLSTANACK